MAAAPTLLDFRRYRPCAVLALDLVKHTAKPKATAQRARRFVEEIFAGRLAMLGIDATRFNYTGDGYLCAFIGDDSSRVIDFINGAIPLLTHELKQLGQEFRAGVDFGLVHFAANALTHELEHFDTPGVIAARLEQAALPNEVLASKTLRDIFFPVYPEVFGGEPRVVQSKDRELFCYPVTAIDFADIQRVFRSVLFSPRSEPLTQEQRGALLVVDDDDGMRLGLCGFLEDIVTSVDVAANGREAIKMALPGRYTLILLDLMLPDTSGLDVAAQVLAADPSQSIVMMSGAGTLSNVQEFFRLGGSYFLQKPFDPDELVLQIDRCLRKAVPSAIRQHLELVCDDVGLAARKVQQVSERFEAIASRTGSDAAVSLLRHKAKGLAEDFVNRLTPGCDVIELLDTLAIQLSAVQRLCSTIERAQMVHVLGYLQSLARDYGTLYPKVEVRVTAATLDAAPMKIQNASLYTLSVCELIDNAVAAVHSGGAVDVDISLLEAAGVLHTRVRDSGRGLPPDIVARISEGRFAGGYSTKGVGHGLGLSLVHDAVARLGGTIEYSMRDGSTFTLSVPLR